ncbi:4-(cytidine 5'-diphospho)-2-C-methyl-D-erythritol kinase [Acetobacter fabarum]|uniref:4-(cytidine 5'-diphospho)-2-C-methyl-D-erythritol kinase n=1 Tax=Acetobacter TaxID=434 RepID=UPI000A390240|nr:MULTISPECIES: 4-(cytidine 5'-diphospho)-2-C-methyl-D-erythritol kinase [Acetobacter]MCI1242899.1 4-(cytidine 5'-diphospho)-2-C-methyl-D-erythritol kinase [Acetobacter fabarum]MDN6713973.1 4-(cytidine 5'-diphospho)-2-C-methyl-D-erythritol kinase [Acetobacter sp.]MCI1910208.1 4-(cytidine 5'-diphospho)-2-C-methyl-D-erythritol kinase [Acetobacter fabarum]MCI1928706.1 4-(cytidine 5'-diphospho)-2-C-methyl-D-erythritol kinase [Acetobacter fabarum]MCI1947557.1 4-(cytidine 5'-diphospho)-2-C-methyl-D
MTVAALDVSTFAFTEAAPAKVNLYLHVTGRRADGYHLLDSLVVFAGAGDVLHYQPGPEPLSLHVTGRFGRVLDAASTGADNLVLRAAHALQGLRGSQTRLPGGTLVLEKKLPVASGIGGGSADAAAALRLLDRAWNVQASRADLLALAQTLGADVPVCLLSQTMRMEGIGENLTPAAHLPECGMVLVNCGQAVSTPEVFRRRDGAFLPRAPLPDNWADIADVVAFLKQQGNSLEEAACAVCPPVGHVLADIGGQDGCLMARMSGSGATCFGLFATPQAARQAADRLEDAHSAWWVWGGGLV